MALHKRVIPQRVVVTPYLAPVVVFLCFHHSCQLRGTQYGFAGAMWPWESAFTGCDCVPEGDPEGRYEQHITGDIVVAFRQYWYVHFPPTRYLALPAAATRRHCACVVCVLVACPLTCVCLCRCPLSDPTHKRYATGNRTWLESTALPVVDPSCTFFQCRASIAPEHASIAEAALAALPEDERMAWLSSSSLGPHCGTKAPAGNYTMLNVQPPDESAGVVNSSACVV